MEWFFTGYGSEARIAAVITPIILAIYWALNSTGNDKGKGPGEGASQETGSRRDTLE